MQEARMIRVRDSAEVVEFLGVRIADVSTEANDAIRWTDMALYRLADDTERYLLHIIGKSVVFHAKSGSCNSGVATRVDELPDDAEPCSKCKPRISTMEDDEIVNMEEDRYSVYVCENAAAVIAKLRVPRTSGTYAAGAISGLGQRLLTTAARNDDGIQNAMMRVRKL